MSVLVMGLPCPPASTVGSSRASVPIDSLAAAPLNVVYGTVALCHPGQLRSMIPMLCWSDGDCQVVEGDAEPLAVGEVGGDVVVAAAKVLHERVTGGEDPR